MLPEKKLEGGVYITDQGGGKAIISLSKGLHQIFLSNKCIEELAEYFHQMKNKLPPAEEKRLIAKWKKELKDG